MRARVLWARWLVVAGLAAMMLGALDPLEGSLVIVPGTGLAALGAFLGRSRRRVFSYWALLLVAIGVAAMVGVSAAGGLGEGTGRSLRWAVLIVVPYAAGWLLGCIGAVSAALEFFPAFVPGLTFGETGEYLAPFSTRRTRATFLRPGRRSCWACSRHGVGGLVRPASSACVPAGLVGREGQVEVPGAEQQDPSCCEKERCTR